MSTAVDEARRTVEAIEVALKRARSEVELILDPTQVAAATRQWAVAKRDAARKALDEAESAGQQSLAALTGDAAPEAGGLQTVLQTGLQDIGTARAELDRAEGGLAKGRSSGRAPGVGESETGADVIPEAAEPDETREVKRLKRVRNLLIAVILLGVAAGAYFLRTGGHTELYDACRDGGGSEFSCWCRDEAGKLDLSADVTSKFCGPSAE